MKKVKEIRDAAFVQDWISNFDPKNHCDVFAGNKIGENLWECEICLAPINKRIKGKGDTELKAVLDASSKAKIEIDKYVLLHPETELKFDYSKLEYEALERNDGSLVEVHLSNESINKYCKPNIEKCTKE